MSVHDVHPCQPIRYYTYFCGNDGTILQNGSCSNRKERYHCRNHYFGRSRTTESEREEFNDADEFAISSIGVPLITGPGAITGVMLLSGQTPTVYSIGTLLIAVLITMIIFYFILRAGDGFGKRFGGTGMRVIQRIMGLILMVIAVQFVINGLETIVKRL